MAQVQSAVEGDISRKTLAGIEVNAPEIEPRNSSALEGADRFPSPVSRIRAMPMIHRPLNGDSHLYPTSPTGSVRSSFGSRRRVSRHSQWSSSFTRSHRSEVSREITAQAESEFLALIELMSAMSRRSSSLKEVWTKIISERESWSMEMDRLNERCEEFSELVERKEKETHGHNHEHEERKKEAAKLRLELSAAMSSTAELRSKLGERERELGDTRREIAELKDNFQYLKGEHEETKTTLEETRLKLVASEDACRHAEADGLKYHNSLRELRHTYVELQTSHTELTHKCESTHKELMSTKELVSTSRQEKEEWMHEKGELDGAIRKCKHREDELTRKLRESIELYEKRKHEVHELRENVSKVNYEREELSHKISDMKRHLEEEHGRWEDAEDRCDKWKLKWEHSERDLVSIREELRVIKSEHAEVQESMTMKSEEARRLIIELGRVEDSHNFKCKEVEDGHRKLIVLQESLHRTETTLKDKNELIHTLHERIERVESDRDDARTKYSNLSNELASLQTSSLSLKLELETATTEREGLREKLRECEQRYEEVCETFTEYDEGNSSFEYEITSLRSMLHEVREQKEKAIAHRNAADHERDESIAKYEAKCREMDKLEESFSHHMHSCGKPSGGGRTVTRRYVRESNGTVIGGGDEGDSVGHGGMFSQRLSP